MTFILLTQKVGTCDRMHLAVIWGNVSPCLQKSAVEMIFTMLIEELKDTHANNDAAYVDARLWLQVPIINEANANLGGWLLREMITLLCKNLIM